MDDRLGEACGSRGEIDRRVVVVRQLDSRTLGGAVGNKTVVALRKGGTVLTHIQPGFDALHARTDLLYTSRELGTENDKIGIGFFTEAIL